MTIAITTTIASIHHNCMLATTLCTTSGGLFGIEDAYDFRAASKYVLVNNTKYVIFIVSYFKIMGMRKYRSITLEVPF